MRRSDDLTANDSSDAPDKGHYGISLGLMFRVPHHLPDHGLYDADVTIECASEEATSERNPEVWGKADEEKREDGASATNKDYRPSAFDIADATPVHAAACLGEREGRDEQTGEEGGV